tara:strand:+ start:6306 stop:7865 length:1560 start_codon:yes stop_codon:yes gene_type:complete
MFNLKVNQSELKSSNQGVSKMAYDQQAPTRDVTGSSFPNGAIHYKWSVGGSKHWVPNKSYIRARVKISKEDGTQLVKADNVAPNMFLMSNLFQSMEFRIGGKTVSKITDFVPQIEALKNRTRKSKAWLDSAGDSTIITNSSFGERQAIVCLGGNQAVEQVLKPELDLPAAGTLAYTTATGAIALAAGMTAANVKEAFPVGSVLNLAGNIIPVIGHLAGGILGGIGATAGNIGASAVFHRVDTIPGTARGVMEVELCWQPCLSIFGIDHALPAGDYELVLNPQSASTYKEAAIESTGATKTGGAGNDFELEVQNMYLYVATAEGPRVDNKVYLLDLEDIQCSSDNVDSTSFAQKNFSVSPSTYALTVAYQDSRVNSDTRASASKLKVNNAGFTLANEELGLNRLYVNYAGQNFPSPDADPSFDADTDRTTQRYINSVISGGSYYSAGGCETIDDWHKRGSYHMFQTAKDGSDTSTRVTVHSGFGTADTANMRLLLFSHSRSTARITIESGSVINVEVSEV